MTSTRIISFHHRRGSYKKDESRIWMRNLINLCISEGICRPTLIIDNAPVHSELESILMKNENVEIVILGPYSYLINPIELVWSAFKSLVKLQLREKMPKIFRYVRLNNQSLTIADFRMRILEEISDSAILNIPQQSLIGYSNHVEIYYVAALTEEDISE